MKIIITESQFIQITIELQNELDKLKRENESVINRYEEIKDKLNKINYLENPKYTYTVDSRENIIAKVKGPDNNWISIHLGPKKRFDKLPPGEFEDKIKDILIDKFIKKFPPYST